MYRFPKSTLVLAVVCIALASDCLVAQEKKAIDEIWFGTLDVKVAKLRLECRMNRAADGTYQGAMFSLDQGNAQIEINSFVIADEKLRIKCDKISAEFEGTLDKSGAEANGTWTQLGNSTPLIFRKVTAVPDRKHTESWKGTLTAGAKKFDFQIRVYQDSDKVTTAVLDSFNESAIGLNIDLTKKGSQFDFSIPISAANFEGKLAEDGKSIEGIWKQGGIELPLSFESVPLEQTRVLDLQRPQNPKPPFPYDIEMVTIPAANGSIQLSATLTKPKGDKKSPVAILISGSGPQDRDEAIMGHRPFWVIADFLTRRGIAVLRFDERGVGESTGEFPAATTKDFANDVEAIVDFLKQHKSIDGKHIALIGHSEGAIIGPMIAARRNDIAAVVMMAGPGVTGAQIILNQTRLIAAAAGVNETVLDAQEEMLNKIVMATVDQRRDKKFVEQALADLKDSLSPELAKTIDPADLSKTVIQQFASPWFEFFLTYDPGPALAKLKMPVLVMNGEKDLQVDPNLNLPVIEAQLKAAGNKDFEIVRLENLNHLFQNCQTGEPEEYMSIEETFDPAALELIGRWLTQRLDVK